METAQPILVLDCPHHLGTGWTELKYAAPSLALLVAFFLVLKHALSQNAV